MKEREEKVLFSVLVANFNNASFLNDAIQSVLDQSYGNWEVIFVDDASTDNSLEVINKYAGDKRIKLYVNEKNYGCGYSKRKCVEQSNGEICGFLDPDDLLDRSALEVMVNEHLKNRSASLIYSSCYHCNPSGEIVKLVEHKPVPAGTSYLELAYRVQTVGHFATFKRSKYLETEGIEPGLKRAVDQDLYFKCEEVGELIAVDAPLYLYRIHDRGISTLGNHKKAIAWHIHVAIKACERRGIAFENVISDLLTNIFENSFEYRYLRKAIAPLRKIVRKFKIK